MKGIISFFLIICMFIKIGCGLPKGGTPPTPVRTLSIDNGEPYTKTRDVNLNIYASDSPTEMYITNTAGCASGGVWETYSTTRRWVLAQLYGTATIYIRFKYSTGTISGCISDTILYSHMGFGGQAKDVFLSGNYLYVAKEYRGLEIYDITTPTAPALVASFDTPGLVYSVYVLDDYAYLADYRNGLVIVDVSTPAEPQYVTTYPLEYVRHAYVSGNYAYLSASDDDGSNEADEGMYIIDITTKNLPSEISSYTNSTTGVEINRSKLSGTDLYCIGGGNTEYLYILDVSTINSPSLQNTSGTQIVSGGELEDLDISGNYIYFADSEKGLVIYNISTKTAPTLSDSYNYSGTEYGILIDGNYAYLASGSSGLVVVNVSDTTTPDMAPATTTGTMSDTTTEGYDSRNLVKSGDYIYIADNVRGIKVISVATVSSPSLLGKYYTSAEAKYAVVDGNYAYVADNTYGLDILDVTNPGNPSLLGSYGSYNTAFVGVAVSGDYVYGISSSTLYIINVSNKAAPSLEGSTGVSSATDIHVSGDYAYVSSGIGLNIINISNKSSPSLAGTYLTTGDGQSVYYYQSDNQVYLTDSLMGFLILDVSTPSAITLVGSKDTVGSAQGIMPNGDYVYLANGGVGLVVMDISTPTSPTISNPYHNDAQNANDLTLSGNYLYMANNEFGVSIYNVLTPTIPAFIKNYDTAGTALSVVVDSSSKYLYVADGPNGLEIINIEIPYDPIQ